MMVRYAFITGGLGFIGSFITRELIEKKLVDKVVCLDHFGRYIDSTRIGFTDYRKARFQGQEDSVIVERGESKYISVMFDLIATYRPRYIIHLAALPLAKLNNLNSQEAMEGSVQSTSNLLEIIGQMKKRDGYCPERFVYASSSMVYGDFQSNVATEEHPTNPKEIYGTMKLAGEVVTKGLGMHHGIDYSIVRPSAVYGPTDMNRRVSQIFIDKAMRGETLNIQGRDEALDFTYIKDTAKGFVLAATHENAVNETFNITHGKAHTLLQYAECLKKHFPDLRYEVTERDAFRPKRGTLSIEKAKRLMGFEPQYSLEDGIDEYVSFINKYNAQ